MTTEIDHTKADKSITIKNKSVSFNLTNIEGARTAEVFIQEYCNYIKSKGGLVFGLNDASPAIITSGLAASGGVSHAIAARAISLPIFGAGSFLGKFISSFKIKTIPPSEIQANIAKDIICLGKELGLNSISIKLSKDASIGIGCDIPGFNAELTKSDGNTIELNVTY